MSVLIIHELPVGRMTPFDENNIQRMVLNNEDANLCRCWIFQVWKWDALRLCCKHYTHLFAPNIGIYMYVCVCIQTSILSLHDRRYMLSYRYIYAYSILFLGKLLGADLHFDTDEEIDLHVFD